MLKSFFFFIYREPTKDFIEIARGRNIRLWHKGRKIPRKTSAVTATRRLNIWLMTQSKRYLPSMDIGWNHTGCVQTTGQCKHRKMPEPMFGHEGPPVGGVGGGKRGRRRARNRVGELMWSAEKWRLRRSSSQWSLQSTSREVKFTFTLSWRWFPPWSECVGLTDHLSDVWMWGCFRPP